MKRDLRWHRPVGNIHPIYLFIGRLWRDAIECKNIHIALAGEAHEIDCCYGWTDWWPLLVHCEQEIEVESVVGQFSIFILFFSFIRDQRLLYAVCARVCVRFYVSAPSQFVDRAALLFMAIVHTIFIYFYLRSEFIFKPFNLSNLYVGRELAERRCQRFFYQLINNYEYYMRHSLTLSHSFTHSTHSRVHAMIVRNK